MPQNQARDPTVAAWVAEQGPPEAAIPPSQDATPGKYHHKRRHHRPGHERTAEQGPPPPAAFPTNVPMPPAMPQQQQFTTKPKHMSTTNQVKMHARMDDRPDWNVDDSNSDEDIAPPSCFAGGQTIFSNPAMPLRQRTTIGQQQMHNQDESESESESESGQISQPQTMPVGMISPMGTAVPPVMPPAEDTYGGQQQMRHHGMPEYGHMPQPSATMSPPETFAMAPAAHTAPVMTSNCSPSDEKRHGHRSHHQASREPGTGPGQDPQPLSIMPSGPSTPSSIASPVRMTMPLDMPPAQDAYGGQHQRHRRGASVVSYHEQALLPSTAQPPHRTMRECMASMAEEAMLANPTQSIALRPGPPPPPECPLPWTQNPILRAESQAASRMPDPRDMQFPMAPPQAGTMTIAAADAPAPPHPQNRRRTQRPGQQSPPLGMSSRAYVAAASAAGTPGPQAMAVRPPPGGLSGPPAMSSTSRREPPPTSMPPFPGAGPSTPGSMNLARAPPPPVPTRPLLLREDD